MVGSQDATQSTPIIKISIMIVLISGAFVAILNQTLLATALPHIMRDLDIDVNIVLWLQSVFLLVNGIMIPITALLIQRFTTWGLFLTAMGLFVIGTVVCSVVPSFSLLMVGSVLLASAADIIMPLMQII